MPARSAELLSRYLEVGAAPSFLVDWLDRFVEPTDAEVVLAVAEGGPPSRPTEELRRLLRRAWRRGFLDGSEEEGWKLASFSTRYEIWSLFEGWKDVPLSVRRELNEIEIQAYLKSVCEATERHPQYLLLGEAEVLIREAPRVYLWPCDCRSMIGACRKPVLTCLRFSNDRELGWEISRERALEIVALASRAGLIHTGEAVRDAGGVITGGALCNCCADCCFEQIAAARLGRATTWPLVRHRAQAGHGCSGCGRCVHRCPFGAVTVASREGPMRIDGSRCRGCGACAVTCPEGAISMLPLA